MANEKHSLLYGIRDGKAVYIDELDLKKDKGLKCGCTCPRCGSLLQARLNFKDPNRVRHFAHHKPIECDIMRANQTAIHLMAKEIILTKKQIQFPAVEFKLSKTQAYKELPIGVKDAYSSALHALKYTITTPLSPTIFDQVELEQSRADFIPDVIATKDGTECLIEIAVTHFIDNEKEEKIRELGLSVLEIDLRSFNGDRTALEQLILNDVKHKKWIYNALWRKKANEIEQWARLQCDSYLEQRKQAIAKATKEAEAHKQREIRRIADQRKAVQQEREKERAQAAIMEGFNPQRLENWLANVTNDESFSALYETLPMSSACPLAPFYVNIPISGEFIFDCDRRIWQSLIFDRFIYNYVETNMDGFASFHHRILHWIEVEQQIFPINQKYNVSYKLSPYDIRSYELSPDVLRQYLKYLEKLGFIEYGYKHAQGTTETITAHTIIPPNAKDAQLLKEAVERANPLDPDLEIHIQNYIERKNI